MTAEGRPARDDRLIVVNAANEILDYRAKSEVHRGAGLLHRAFSVFLFDDRGRLLLQQRSLNKPLWPLIWSNSCCSHPVEGESTADAAQRRLGEELGLTAELTELFTFEYRAAYDETGGEHELCTVFVGETDSVPKPDPFEIAAVRWLAGREVLPALTAMPTEFTPWFALEWERIVRDHPERVV